MPSFSLVNKEIDLLFAFRHPAAEGCCPEIPHQCQTVGVPQNPLVHSFLVQEGSEGRVQARTQPTDGMDYKADFQTLILLLPFFSL